MGHPAEPEVEDRIDCGVKMGKPIQHARSSAKQWGGTPEDYLPIHNLLDSSKGAFSDLRHRALTHNSWFITTILEQIFGTTLKNSDGRKISVRDIGEQHVMEDFGGKFIPSAQDYLGEIEFHDWMNNGDGEPPSRKKAQGLIDRINKKKSEKDALREALDSISEMERGSGSRCGGAGMLD